MARLIRGGKEGCRMAVEQQVTQLIIDAWGRGRLRLVCARAGSGAPNG